MTTAFISTEVLARSLGLKPQSIRAAVCRRGSYFGVTPRKFPNGRLYWPADSLDRIMSGEPVNPPAAAA